MCINTQSPLHFMYPCYPFKVSRVYAHVFQPRPPGLLLLTWLSMTVWRAAFSTSRSTAWPQLNSVTRSVQTCSLLVKYSGGSARIDLDNSRIELSWILLCVYFIWATIKNLITFHTAIAPMMTSVTSPTLTSTMTGHQFRLPAATLDTSWKIPVSLTTPLSISASCNLHYNII